MKFLDLQRENAPYAEELKRVAAEVIDSGWFLQGERVASFEQQLCSYLGCRYAVAVGNGLDALRLILKAYIELGVMQEGDEIIVPANTYIATVLAVTDNRLVPVFAEPDERTLNLNIHHLEHLITSRTRAVMPVHLYGRSCWGEPLKELAGKYRLKIIEDNAQAMGARSRVPGLSGSCMSGALGDAAGNSFYPSKNLGALGDAGAVTTSDAELAEVVRALANYGSHRKYYNRYQGFNSRMDELQAAFLSVKLNYLDAENAKRRDCASFYSKLLKDTPLVLPESAGEEHVWHQYIVRCGERDRLQEWLHSQHVDTQIHYPVPPHKQSCYPRYNHLQFPLTERLSQEMLSLPIAPGMTVEELSFVAESVCRFCMGRELSQNK
ncbi:MAG: DegT/DnrJ/EryC1/StrS family aminotransferase [Coprobacter sp.]|nr:DegT/DnrJ/EryC1/StrS family aminotransferase [Coprobacter sp.]